MTKLQTGEEYTIGEIATYLQLDKQTVWRAVDAKSLSARWDTQHNCWMILFENMLSWRSRVMKRKQGREGKQDER